MPLLVLGPLLRYVGETEATVWVETDSPCEVEVLGRRGRTWHVEGHHYALLYIEGLEPGSSTQYDVKLDGDTVWPVPDDPFPPPRIRTPKAGERIRMIWGSCRVSVPHEPPYTLTKDQDPRGREIDALLPLALRMMEQPESEWPHVMLLLGDQVYADEVSPLTRDFIRTRRDVSKPPGEEVADFEEYVHLYLESWRDPAFRWLLSTVSTAMIFDDHDIHDDWNTSIEWVTEQRKKPWWNERVIGGFMSYWIYQHIGNLSPRELEDDELYDKVCDCDDAGPLLREFAFRADRETDGTRWSYCRDIGESRLIVMDSRAGRVLEGTRRMVDENEWDYIARHATGDFHHLFLATTLPWLLAPGMHYLEAWNEKTAGGAWGSWFAKQAEKIRQGLDLEHWAAFEDSFLRVAKLVTEISTGKRGTPPASIVALSGDVHHAYLAEVALPRGSGARTPIYQAVCSPIRNPLGSRERAVIKFAASKPMAVLMRALARAAGVKDPPLRWRLDDRPKFDNQISTLEWKGRDARVWLERAMPGDMKHPRLELSAERELT
ncbi:MAG: hypothetical protein QOE08_2158 [Thermoleophilaceae bacterium]|nr:hypothetical protein [Thermoleophilaceae bacterium]